MTSKPDITPLLPSEGELVARAEALATELAADLADNPRAGHRRRRPWLWRTFLGLIAIPLLGVGIATAAGVFSADDMEVAAGIGCYSEAKLQPESISIIGPRQDPVAACARIWRQGAVKRGRHEAPPLVACTEVDGPVRVIPGRGAAACERLGLVSLPGDYPEASARSEHVEQALHTVGEFVGASTPGGDCVATDEAVADADQRLREAGFDDVAIRVDGDRECGGHFIIDGDGLVLLSISRDQFELRRLDFKMVRALESVSKASSGLCADPIATADRARADLKKAGLAEVEVKIEGQGPCLSIGWGTDPAARTVTLRAISRTESATERG